MMLVMVMVMVIHDDGDGVFEHNNGGNDDGNCDNDNHDNGLGAVSIRKTVLPGMAIPMLKIRRPNGRLIFNMEIAIRR